ncbi:MAG: lipoyl(octanoyl) transferase [Rhodothermaeota bacterium MED-G16]|nr:MAG: lipoyl(octanoyl) transferase [Rhodothermaeota bacterium MED-G16]
MNKEVKILKLGHIDYKKAWDKQEKIFKKIIDTKIDNRKKKKFEQTENYILTCSHPHVYTLGRSGDEDNLLIDKNFIKKENLSFYKINRGGDITYHGPGQIVIYPILDLENFFTDIHKYLRLLEESVILTLKELKIKAGRVDGLTGVWVNQGSGSPKKICAMGVKTSRWVTMHGLALNVNTDLKYFKNIIPCGIQGKDVTSIDKEINYKISSDDVEKILIKNLSDTFKFKIL